MTLKVAFVGTGWGTRVQLPCFRAAGLEACALWGRTEESARREAKRCGVPLATSDYSRLLKEFLVDLVSISAPPHLHADMAVSALESGKHVLCEKPMALDAAQAKRMVAVSQNHPEQLALIDHELRFLPSLRRARALLRDGYVGRCRQVAGMFLSPGRLDADLPWQWWSDRDLGGGGLGAIGSHLLDMMRWLTGLEVEEVVAQETRVVSRRRDHLGQSRAVTADDATDLLLRYEQGVTGTVQLSFGIAGPAVHRWSIAGTEGSLEWSDGRLLGFRGTGGSGENLAEEPAMALPEGVLDRIWERGTIYLAGALRESQRSAGVAALESAATFEDGLVVQRVLDAARESLRTGAWVRP